MLKFPCECGNSSPLPLRMSKFEFEVLKPLTARPRVHPMAVDGDRQGRFLQGWRSATPHRIRTRPVVRLTVFE